MKTSSAIDAWFIVAILFVVVVSFGSIVVVPSDQQWIYFLVVTPINALLLSMLLNTNYELTDEYLICRSGPLKEKIAYDKIASLSLKTNFASSMALSSKRIEIKQHNKNYFTGTTFISPVNREQFYEELKYQCKNLLE